MQFFEHNFQKFSRPFMFYNKFYFSFLARAKTNTNFSVDEELTGRFVKRKYFLHFVGTVPTFGFKISMVENGGSNFSLSYDCGKYENSNQSGNFLDAPCMNVCSIYVGHPINSRTDFM